jgi:hypothetical protein
MHKKINIKKNNMIIFALKILTGCLLFAIMNKREKYILLEVLLFGRPDQDDVRLQRMMSCSFT